MSEISLPWEDDTPSHTLPSLSRFVVPPPPLENFGYASVCIERRDVIFYFRNSLTLPSIFFFFFFFFLGGGGYITSSINVFYEQWIYCFLHTLSSGFKRGQFVCVVRAVQCVLSALSAKVEVADINVNDRCAAFTIPYIKAVSSSECWKILFLEIRFVEFRNILLFSTKWFQLIIFTQYCKYIKVNLCEVLNRSYQRNFLHKKDNKIGKIQFFEKKW